MNALLIMGEVFDWILRIVGIYQVIQTCIKKK